MKKLFEIPEVTRLGTVAELTKTNNNEQITDVPQGSPLSAGDNKGEFS